MQALLIGAGRVLDLDISDVPVMTMIFGHPGWRQQMSQRKERLSDPSRKRSQTMTSNLLIPRSFVASSELVATSKSTPGKCCRRVFEMTSLEILPLCISNALTFRVIGNHEKRRKVILPYLNFWCCRVDFISSGAVE
jgi:hypothetical protein